MQYIVIKKTIESISIDYGRGVEKDIGDQIPKICNTEEPEEVRIERKLEQVNNRNVFN